VGGGGGVREGSFSSHSLGRTRSAALIYHSNSLPTSNVGLNFVPQGCPQTTNVMGLEISEIVGYMDCLTGLQHIYIQKTATRSQRLIRWHISSIRCLIYLHSMETVKLNFHLGKELRLTTTEQWTML
jgi:hypothetical protein